MPRNASGVYSLPALYNPVVARATIAKDWANTTLNDVESELTNSLDRSGRGAMTGQLQLNAGTAALPGLTFDGDTDTGVYRSAANELGFSTGGTVRATLNATALTISAALALGGQLQASNGSVGTPSISFQSDPDCGLYRAGANDVRMAIAGVDLTKYTTKLSVSAATAATGGTRQDALSLTNGDLDMSGVTYPSATTAISNRLSPMHFPKAWTVITITGAATFTITQAVGCNVATVARTTASTFTITFGSAFSSGTYGVTATCISHNLGSGADVQLDPSSLTRNAGSLVGALSVNGTSVASLDGWGGGNVATFTVVLWGQQ